MKTRIYTHPAGYGHWKISAEIEGKELSATTNDSLLIDDLSEDPGDRTYYNNSETEAEDRAIDIIKRANISQFEEYHT